METIQHVRKTDLARQTSEIIRIVQRGQTAVIENHGQPEAAIIDIIDYQIMRAVMNYHLHPGIVGSSGKLSKEILAEFPSEQERYDQVFAYYLAGQIDLTSVAELLGLAVVELHTRCLRLDIPLRITPARQLDTLVNVQQVLQALAASGLITPPPRQLNVESRADTDRIQLAQRLGKAASKPLSEMIIEDRGEW